MNQMRAADDELEKPDWTISGAPYQILTLSRSLSNNQSISVRLQSNKVNRILNSTQNRFLCKPSTTDIFYMEQPQEYLNNELISDDFKPNNDILEPELTEPITFNNPKIRVGVDRKKKH
jgi:hypothetical protein